MTTTDRQNIEINHGHFFSRQLESLFRMLEFEIQDFAGVLLRLSQENQLTVACHHIKVGLRQTRRSCVIFGRPACPCLGYQSQPLRCALDGRCEEHLFPFRLIWISGVSADLRPSAKGLGSNSLFGHEATRDLRSNQWKRFRLGSIDADSYEHLPTTFLGCLATHCAALDARNG
jgi:hypothetical protein